MERIRGGGLNPTRRKVPAPQHSVEPGQRSGGITSNCGSRLPSLRQEPENQGLQGTATALAVWRDLHTVPAKCGLPVSRSESLANGAPVASIEQLYRCCAR
jgi:hypothetical protein